MRWGILSTGHIAQSFARAVLQSQGGQLVAVGSRTEESAGTFAKTFGISQAYGSYEKLLADPVVESVYIATPHPLHAEWAVKAAEAGKHILCEKPLGMNSAEVERMVAAARAHRMVLMEAFMYRCHPQTRELIRLVKEGVIGKLRVIRASFSFDRDLGLQHRLFSKELGGGGILDLGCYPVSMSRLLAGSAMGQPFAEPEEVLGAACLGEKSGVDEYASAVFRFPNGILAEVSCGIRVEREHGTLVLYGTEGHLVVPAPWHCGIDAGETQLLRYAKGAQQPEIVTVPSDRNIYTYEAELFSECVKAGVVQSPAMTPEDSIGNMKVLEQWLGTAK
jgi:predicted dehydrogenase